MVIVRKSFPKQRKKQKNRIWKLKHLDKEAVDENNMYKKKKDVDGKDDRDMQMFIRDIEENPDLRQ
jgi:hypothetical protein